MAERTVVAYKLVAVDDQGGEREVLRAPHIEEQECQDAEDIVMRFCSAMWVDPADPERTYTDDELQELDTFGRVLDDER